MMDAMGEEEGATIGMGFPSLPVHFHTSPYGLSCARNSKSLVVVVVGTQGVSSSIFSIVFYFLVVEV